MCFATSQLIILRFAAIQMFATVNEATSSAAYLWLSFVHWFHDAIFDKTIVNCLSFNAHALKHKRTRLTSEVVGEDVIGEVEARMRRVCVFR